MSEKFTAKYEVADGYVSGSRPQSFKIDAEDVADAATMTDDQVETFFFEMVDEDMSQKVSADGANYAEFLAWVRSLPASKE